MKILFVDTETTGLSAYKSAIHQLSGLVEIDGKLVKKFNYSVRPHEGAEIVEAALNVSGVSKEQIQGYPESSHVHSEFTTMVKSYVNPYDKTDKFFFAAYNSGFDNDFVRQFFKLNNDKFFGSLFHGNSIDIMTLASEFLRPFRHQMENFKLVTVAKKMYELGLMKPVDSNKAHNAIYDIAIAYMIYNVVRLENISNSVKALELIAKK